MSEAVGGVRSLRRVAFVTSRKRPDLPNQRDKVEHPPHIIGEGRQAELRPDLLPGPIQFRQHRLAALASLANGVDFLRQVLDPCATGGLLGGIGLIEALEIVI
jgi:hypothetical protein